jgi:hypothetical protein
MTLFMTTYPSQPLPSQPVDWLNEVLDLVDLAIMAAAGEGLEDEEDQRWVLFMQVHAVSSCRHTRGIDDTIGTPEDELEELETIDELAHSLRNALPGDLREVVNETQLYLLFYIAAHIRAGILKPKEAQKIVQACWQDCVDENIDDMPLDIGVDAPDNANAWGNEIIEAFTKSTGRPSLVLDDGDTFIANRKSMLHVATVLALINRQAVITRDDLEELLATMTAMETDVSNMGPEWKATRRIPAMAFSMYYVWVHLSLGLTNEDMAMAVMNECTERISEFRAQLTFDR